MESGAFYDGRFEQTVEDARTVYLDFARRLGCHPENVTCLVGTSADEVLAASIAISNWHATVDGVDLPMPAAMLAMNGRLAPVPVLAGATSEDAARETSPKIQCSPTKCSEDDARSWFGSGWNFSHEETDEFIQAYDEEVPTNNSGNYTSWYWAMQHAAGDEVHGCMARRAVAWATKAGQKAYFYRWSYTPQGPNGAFPYLAHHAVEVPFVFHVLSETPEENQESGGIFHIAPEEVDFATAIVQYWRGMAADGRPDGQVKWPSYDRQNRSGLEILSNVGQMFREKPNLRGIQCDLWDRVFERSLVK
jgi:hypothetical protein